MSDFFRASYRWQVVSFTTGEPFIELPDLQMSSVEHRMQEYTTVEAQLPWDSIPPDWFTVVQPWRYAIVLLMNEIPLMGWVILKNETTLDGDSVSLQLATADAYLTRCPINDVTYSNTSQTLLADDLIHRYVINGMNNAFRTVTTASSYKRDRTYKASDNKSVYDALNELAQVINGLDWCCDWKHDAATNTYYPEIRVSDVLGRITPVVTLGVESMSDFKVTHDWSESAGANMVEAVSTAEGDIQPTSGWIKHNDTTRPILKYRYSPSSSITNKQTLIDHAQGKLESIKNGVTTVEMTLSLENAPQVNDVWQIGDVIGYDVSEARDRFPDDYKGWFRTIGYKLDFGSTWTLTPYLQQNVTPTEDIQS